MQATSTTEVVENLFFGRLMSPSEIRAATFHNRTVPEHVKRSWSLCGDTSEECFELLQNEHEPAVFRISGFVTNVKSAFAVFTVQVRDHQNRFLFRLGGKRIQSFLESLESNGITVSLGTRDSETAILRDFNFNPVDIRPIRTMSMRSLSRNALLDAMELELATCEILKPKSIASAIPSFSVNHVNLNVIAEHGLNAQ